MSSGLASRDGRKARERCVEIVSERLPRTVDPEWVESSRRVCAPHFVDQRHRRLDVGLASLDRDGFIADTSDMIKVVGPSSVTHHVLPVRGERLVALHHVMTTEQGHEIDAIQLWRLSRSLECVERIDTLEPEDGTVAIAGLDRLHAELGEE